MKYGIRGERMIKIEEKNGELYNILENSEENRKMCG